MNSPKVVMLLWLLQSIVVSFGARRVLISGVTVFCCCWSLYVLVLADVSFGNNISDCVSLRIASLAYLSLFVLPIVVRVLNSVLLWGDLPICCLLWTRCDSVHSLWYHCVDDSLSFLIAVSLKSILGMDALRPASLSSSLSSSSMTSLSICFACGAL